MDHASPPRRTGSQDPEPERDDGRDPEALGRIDLAVTRVRAPEAAPRIAAAAWLVGALVLVSILKPWGGGGPATATLRPDVAASADVTPAPTEDRSATGLALSSCLGTGGWRVATLETWRNRDVRVWRAIEPLVATSADPLDPGVPAVPVVADALSGLGWCAPAYGADEPVGPARVRAWLVVDGVAHSVTLRQVQPEDGITPIAALYLPSSGAWTSGLVVFQYTDTGTGWSGWFAADLTITAAAPCPRGCPPASSVAPPAPTPGVASAAPSS